MTLVNNPRPNLHVDVYRFSFSLSRIHPTLLPSIQKHLGRLIHFTPERVGGNTKMVPSKKYYVADAHKDCFRIPMAFFKETMDALKQYGLREEDITYTLKSNIYSPKSETNFKGDKYKLRTDQVPIVEFMNRGYEQRIPYHPFRTEYYQKDYEDRVSMLKLAPGGGKTLTSLYVTHLNSARTAIVIKPGYIERWYKDGIFEYFNISEDEVFVVQGSASLQYLIEESRLGPDRIKYRYIIFSNRTLLLFFSEYEKNPGAIEELFGCSPYDLFNILGIKTCIYDEVHSDFHFNVTSLCFLDPDNIIGLSGSLESKDPFILKMYNYMFPRRSVYADTFTKKYIRVYPMSYCIDNTNKIRTQEWGSSNYSHNAFEKSIRSKHYRLEQYLKIIDDVSTLLYFKDYVKGDKYGIYASTIDMCSDIVKHLSDKHKDLKVVKYTSGDSYDQLMNCDIFVSTIGKSGTALDIPNLRAILLTIAIDSVQANIQLPGRLRDLKTRDVKFGWIYCENIPKHVLYSHNRKKIIAPKAEFIKDIHTFITIKTDGK